MKSLFFITLALGLTALASPSFDAIKVDEHKVTLEPAKFTEIESAQFVAVDPLFDHGYLMVAEHPAIPMKAILPEVVVAVWEYRAPTIRDTLRAEHPNYSSRNSFQPRSRVLHVLNC